MRDLLVDWLGQTMLQPLSELSQHLLLLMWEVFESLLSFKRSFHAPEVILAVVCIYRRSYLCSHARRHDLVECSVPLLVSSLLASALDFLGLLLVLQVEEILFMDTSIADRTPRCV